MFKPTPIPALTGLRFLAAFSIVFGHFGLNAHYTLFGFRPQTTIIGMPLFFTMSGFIIHYVYAESFLGDWRAATRTFALARFSRLYPLFFFLLVYYILFSPMGPAFFKPENFSIALSYATLTSSWWYTTVDNLALIEWSYGASWSVSTECFFYLCYALILYRISAIRNFRTCLFVLLGFCLCAYALLYTAFATTDLWEPLILAQHPEWVGRTANFAQSFYRWLFYVSPYFHLLEFIGGVLTCQLFILARHEKRLLDKRITGIFSWTAVIWMIAFMFLFFYLSENGTKWLTNNSLSGFFMFLHMSFLLAPACYLLIFALAAGGCTWSRILSAGAIVFLGEISYSIYLGHNLVAAFAYIAPNAAYSTLRLAMAVSMVCIFACGLYTMVEVPAKRRLRRLAS